MAKYDYRARIRKIADERGIVHLCHFTPAPNLNSIVEYGLLCRDNLSASERFAYTSSDHRLDSENRAISISISAVNHRMFEGKRAKSGRIDWIVLILCPSVLWTHECRFYARNAARREMHGHRGFLGGPWALNEMFSPISSPSSFTGESYRSDTGIPDCLTTYSDAEVQVLEPISSRYLIGAWVSHISLAEKVQLYLNQLSGPERDVLVRDFSPRFSNEFDTWG